MSYATILDSGTRTARKEHLCFDCGRPIVPGAKYLFQVNTYEGCTTIKQHPDCADASEHYRIAAGLLMSDFWDGIPPLTEMISDGGEFDLDCALLRGHFPHVVCRLEFSRQKRT